MTESGASHVPLADTPSGAAYARNYLSKVMPLAHRAGIEAIHWFILSDAAEPSTPFDTMGLYEALSSLVSIDDAKLTTNGVALHTLSSKLADAVVSEAVRDRVTLGDDADVVGYRLADGRAAWIAWARSDIGESATASLDVQANAPLLSFAWDASQTGASAEVLPRDGRVTVEVTTSPVILVEGE